ncbi:MAG: hypothetical protein COV29_01540 [Candidatus Yanofskybacteria bacterium CG10_big_fil_rev_8_21_14_0_10_36_16]|uniref:Uncharacterized protein n=1 Tax=Candidatus Yanofskybacteria bacterium CG10_big_fil_rev_8_21_14_0_10_36_16 TaxID=1975096 RepID=A0A2J0Q794_9BACT|nr:MAG: hypothetical protein COV29_01540 [Candidatus Yanofskybacteria bacterium CG10_big_fil_rev_8_21_14_0_10_36_16]
MNLEKWSELTPVEQERYIGKARKILNRAGIKSHSDFKENPEKVQRQTKKMDDDTRLMVGVAMIFVLDDMN